MALPSGISSNEELYREIVTQKGLVLMDLPYGISTNWDIDWKIGISIYQESSRISTDMEID